MIALELVRSPAMAKTRQRLHVVVEKGGIIALVPDVPLKSLEGALKDISKINLGDKVDRSIP